MKRAIGGDGFFCGVILLKTYLNEIFSYPGMTMRCTKNLRKGGMQI
jgi:hypothetical protein